MAPEELESLARHAQQGDRRALNRLLEELAPVMARALHPILPSASLEDGLQEALLAFTRALPNFRFECGVRHFAFRVALRGARSLSRIERRSRARFVSASAYQDPPDRADLEERTDARLKVQRLLGLIEALPEELRETYTLRVVVGMTTQELSLTLGIPEGTVKSRLRRAKEKLGKHLLSLQEASPKKVQG